MLTQESRQVYSNKEMEPVKNQSARERTSRLLICENEVNESKLKAIRTSTHGWIPKETGVIKSLYNGFLMI